MKIKLILCRWLYTLFFTMAIPLVLMRLLLRSWKLPAYRRRWLERFGHFTTKIPPNGLWLHAVSVGEVITAVPIVKKFQQRHPNLPITITTTTPTGSECVKTLFAETVFHVYFPYDIPACINGFLNRVNPALCVLMETELWLNTIWACHHRQIPVLIANARLSPRSMLGYQQVKGLMKALLRFVTLVAAQSRRDGDRFLALGLEPQKMVVAGNVKFDFCYPEEYQLKGKALRTAWDESRPVWIAASTHQGEEVQVLSAFKRLRMHIPTALLILVPRHPDRFREVARFIKQSGLKMTRRSKSMPTPETEVYLGDTLGDMNILYRAADIAFIGGSLMEVGGHNMLEPAAAGIPIITGPHIFNFLDISEILVEAGAMIKISDETGLTSALLRWFKKPKERKTAGEKGRIAWENNRGAVIRVINLMETLIPGQPSTGASIPSAALHPVTTH